MGNFHTTILSNVWSYDLCSKLKFQDLLQMVDNGSHMRYTSFLHGSHLYFMFLLILVHLVFFTITNDDHHLLQSHSIFCVANCFSYCTTGGMNFTYLYSSRENKTSLSNTVPPFIVINRVSSPSLEATHPSALDRYT